jgi:hypothetical protein
MLMTAVVTNLKYYPNISLEGPEEDNKQPVRIASVPAEIRTGQVQMHVKSVHFLYLQNI